MWSRAFSFVPPLGRLVTNTRSQKVIVYTEYILRLIVLDNSDCITCMVDPKSIFHFFFTI